MKIEKVENLAGNLYDKIEHVIHIINLKQALNHGLVLEKSDQIDSKCFAKTIYWYKYWSKKKSKNGFKKDFFKLMNNAVFGKNYGKYEKSYTY